MIRMSEEINIKFYDPEIEELRKENQSLRTRIKTIKRTRKAQTQKKNKYKELLSYMQNSLTIKNNNWNELKKWLEEKAEDNKDFIVYRLMILRVLDKIQEIETGIKEEPLNLKLVELERGEE